MAYQAYRVRKNFGWNGWQYAPGPECACQCSDSPEFGCSGRTATSCKCKGTSCHCHCGLSPETYGGDIWFALEGDTRLEMMMRSRQAVPDASLPSADELLKEPRFARLLELPREPATASARGGRR